MLSTGLLTASSEILDSLSDGVYVCDKERTIVFWSKAAERITGWQSSDVLGRRCLDDVLCHIDKDGHRLCGKEFCPLHRAMVTGTQSTVGIIVFAKGKAGNRIPMQVTVAPIRNPDGEIIGGVETFRDVSAVLADLERRGEFRPSSMETDLPADPRVRFSTYYVPHDLVGGDFYAIRQLDGDHYGFLLADVMGHGVAAALHTMHLSSLWDRHCHLLAEPVTFAQHGQQRTRAGGERRVVRDRRVRGDRRQAADPAVGFRRRSAGPGARANGTMEQLESSGLPFGMMAEAGYEEMEARFDEGDSLLLFSDGAVEVHNAQEELLGTEGLVHILQETGYPAVRPSDERHRGAALAVLQRHPAERRPDLYRGTFLKH